MLFKQIFILLVLTCSLEASNRALYATPWGKDSSLKWPTKEQPPAAHSMAVDIAHRVIQFHQTVLSPVDGPRSHFYPSSSQYMRLAMENYGFWRGFLMGCDRLIRENEDKWVYRTVEAGERTLKYDPAVIDKYQRF